MKMAIIYVTLALITGALIPIQAATNATLVNPQATLGYKTPVLRQASVVGRHFNSAR